MTPHKSMLDDAVLAVVMVALFALVGTIWRVLTKSKRKASEPLPEGVTYTSPLESASYAIAGREQKAGNIIAGLMAKSLAETDGDATKANARYLKLRASQLQATLSCPDDILNRSMPTEQLVQEIRKIIGQHMAPQSTFEIIESMISKPKSEHTALYCKMTGAQLDEANIVSNHICRQLVMLDRSRLKELAHFVKHERIHG